MNRKKIILILGSLLILIIFYFGLPYAYWMVRAIYEPDGITRIGREFEKLPSDILIKKIYSIYPISPYPGVAMRTLAERKETKAVPELVKFTKSWNPDKRYQAIRALGNIGDKRAIEPLLVIINKGEGKNNPNYNAALFSLCQIGYEPICPIVLEMLKRPDGARNGATAMMEYIGKREDIPILEDMFSKVLGNDVNARLDRSGIKKAMEAIKQKEKIKSKIGTATILFNEP